MEERVQIILGGRTLIVSKKVANQAKHRLAQIEERQRRFWDDNTLFRLGNARSQLAGWVNPA